MYVYIIRYIDSFTQIRLLCTLYLGFMKHKKLAQGLEKMSWSRPSKVSVLSRAENVS